MDTVPIAINDCVNHTLSLSFSLSNNKKKKKKSLFGKLKRVKMDNRFL